LDRGEGRISKLIWRIGIRVSLAGMAYVIASLLIFPGHLGPVGLAFVVFVLSVFVGLMTVGYRIYLWAIREMDLD